MNEPGSPRVSSSGTTGPDGARVTRRRWRVVLVLCLAAAVFHSGVLLLRHEPRWVTWWSDLGWTWASLLAAAKCFDTASRKRGSERRGWLCFGGAAFVWLLGMLIWNYLELVERVMVPFPRASDALFLLSSPMFVAGFWYQKRSVPSAPLTIKQVGDLGVTLSVCLMVGAMILYRPASLAGESFTYTAVAVAYPILRLCALMFGLTCLWQHRWGSRRRVVTIQLVAVASLAVVDTLYGHSLLTHTYQTGHVIDVVWLIAFCLLIWAAYEADWLAEGVPSQRPELSSWDALIPSTGVLGLTGVGFIYHDQWTADLMPLLVGAGVMLALFMGMRAWGNSELLRSLVREVRREERRLRALLDDAPIGIAYIQDGGRVAICNRRLGQLTNGGSTDLLQGEEWVGSGVAEQIRHAMRRRERSVTEHTLAAPEPGHAGARDHLPSELQRHIQLSVAPLEKGGALVLVADGTEQHMLLKQLVEVQKMEAVGGLAGGLAHDFNNLLTAMLAGVSLARLKSRATEVDAHLEHVEQSMWQAAELTQRLLALSRRREARMGPMRPAEVIRRAAKLLERSIPETIRISVDIQDEPLCILGDGGQLEQALINLALNARDAMPEGGQLELKMRVTELTAASARTQPGAFVVLSVTDTGEGIPSELQSRVFEPFFTTKAAGEGTGLGLAMVYASMKEQGGWATVSSLVGRGTTVSLYLPARAADPGELEVSRTDHLPRGSERVLVVDDRDAPLMAAKAVLEACGYRVTLAWSGAEALERASRAEQAFDLILTDAVMPGIGGRRLMAELKARQITTPVILVTGYEVDPHTEADGFAAVLAKPYDAQELARVVRRVLDAAALPAAHAG
ncbi:MAG: response regulator [Polyangiaceae bacterium]|nr:response regulator [Polyangiaceae bacterium]MCW5790437.1 response regulator [Polyangiaceae bacterium]